MKLTQKTSKDINLEELKAAIAGGKAHDVINPFDEIGFTLDTGEEVVAVCAYVGDNFARFVLKDCFDASHVMNHEATNAGGYYGSEMRRYIVEEVYRSFPPELRNAIRPRDITEAFDGEEFTYSESLWLPSATDVFGDDDRWDDEPESFQLPIFELERDRVKERADIGTAFWWLRSPRASSATTFVLVTMSGSVKYIYAHGSFGVAPGFDL
jgi:hypothetical protein